MKSFAPKSAPRVSQTKPADQRPLLQNGLSAKAGVSPNTSFVDCCPEVKGQQELQAMADRSPRVQYLQRLKTMADNGPLAKAQAQSQAMADSSPRQVAQRQRMERLSGPALQRQEGLKGDELQMKVAQKQEPEEEEQLRGEVEPPVQRQVGLEEDEKLSQSRFADHETPAQRYRSDKASVNRTGMPDQLKSGLEQLSGMDLSDVRVRYNSPKPSDVNALAYAQGRDIHLSPGQEKHLPHEGWHVVQQMQERVRATKQTHGLAINDDKGLEREADVMGAKAMRMNSSAKPLQGLSSLADKKNFSTIIQREEIQVFLHFEDLPQKDSLIRVQDKLSSDDLYATVTSHVDEKIRANFQGFEIKKYIIVRINGNVVKKDGGEVKIEKDQILKVKIDFMKFEADKRNDKGVDSEIIEIAKSASEGCCVIGSCLLGSSGNEGELKRQQCLDQIINALENDKSLRVVLIDPAFKDNKDGQVVDFLTKKERAVISSTQKNDDCEVYELKHKTKKSTKSVEILYVSKFANAPTAEEMKKANIGLWYSQKKN